MRNGILVALAGTSLIVFAMLSIPLVFAVEGSASGAKSYVTEECYSTLCQVKMANLMFVPDTLIVKRLADIVWTNNDNVRHMVTSGSYGSIEAPLASAFIEPSESYKFSFQKPGKYQYFCQMHPNMRGVVLVEGAIVPEFPSIALLIVAGAFAPIIAMTRLRKNIFKMGI